MAKLTIESRYGIAPNEFLQNPSLSLKAKWLFVYIQSKPDDWDFSAERIAMESKDGVESVYSALTELDNAGFLTREKRQNPKWHWEMEYTLHATAKVPEKENPTQGITAQGFPAQENAETIVNNTTVRNITVRKKEVIPPTPKGDSGQELILSDFQNSELSEKFREFEKHRKELKEKLTPTNRAAIVKKLSMLDPQEAIDQLQQSIENGWRGIFPVKADWRDKKDRKDAEKEFMSHIVIR